MKQVLLRHLSKCAMSLFFKKHYKLKGGDTQKEIIIEVQL
jgi:hypothetical protein